MKLILLTGAVFCLLHAFRDYLQIKGVKNWFTQVGHVWDAPQYEKHSIVVFTILGGILLYFLLN